MNSDIIYNYTRKDFHGRPAGLWSVLALLALWTLLKGSDLFFIIKGEARLSTVISSIIIVPVNIICLTGLLRRNEKIYDFTGYWFWLAYMVSVFIFPQYTAPGERAVSMFMMAVIMLPLLAGWFILRDVRLRDKFIQRGGE